jgi:copper chaperone
MTTQFEVPDASCGHCKSTIESAVSALAEVTRAELDLATKRLTVEHGNSLDVAQLTNAIQKAGYTPEPVA